MANLKFILSTSVLVLTFVLLDVQCQYVEHGWDCNENNTCRSDLNCISGRCACLHPGHQIYDSNSRICISQVLGPCIMNEVTVDMPCATNAECRNETGFPECMCRPGTRQNGRNCRAEFGQPCRTNDDCHNVNSFDNVVICRNEICDCAILETYDVASGRCLGLVGARCGSSYMCVQGATCDRFDSFNGICRCTESFLTTPDRRCSLFQCPKP